MREGKNAAEGKIQKVTCIRKEILEVEHVTEVLMVVQQTKPSGEDEDQPQQGSLL